MITTFITMTMRLPIKAALADRKKVVKTGSIFMGSTLRKTPHTCTYDYAGPREAEA